MNAAEFARQRHMIDRRCHGHHQKTRAMAHLIRDARATLVVMERKIVGYRLPNGEIVCIKVRYRDEARAVAEIERIQAANINGDRVPVRAYFCTHCRGWHTTSQSRIAA